jgi:malonate transporter
MNESFGIVLPVFGLIGVGYVVAWTNVAGKGSGEALADFVFTVAIPVLLFRTIVVADFSAAAPWRLWLAYFTGFAVAWVAGDQIVRRLFGRDHRAGVVGGVSSAYSNAVLIGIPLTITAYGEHAAVAIALIVAVHLPVAMTVSVVLIDRAERLDGVATGRLDALAAATSVLKGLATNPLIVGIGAGILWRLTGIVLGGPVGIVVDRLAGVAGTLALISVGMTLRQYGIGRNVPAGLVLSAVKLLVLPLTVLLVTRFMVLPPVWVKVAVVTAACPTGVNAYLIANRFRTGEALASNAIAISTAIAVVTTALWLQVMTWF